MCGLFISFEGGDGTGKSTQVAELAKWLRQSGFAVVTTCEPGGTDLGLQIRQLLLHGNAVAPRAEALLYAADRAHHVAEKIRPALAKGSIVISDRYLDSSIAYQGAARALPKDEIRNLSLWATENLLPDLSILLDLPVATSAQRVGHNQDRLEAEGSEFHQRVRDEFRELAAANPHRFHVIDAQQSITQIAAQIQAIVTPLLDSQKRNLKTVAPNATRNPASSPNPVRTCDAK